MRRFEPVRADKSGLATAIERDEWERIMLHLFVVLAELLQAEGRATIDDLIDLLDTGSAADDD